MEEKAKRGKYLGFAHPYSYNYGNNRLTINPVEAPVVKKIYDLYINGRSLGKIAAYLKKNRIPTKKNGAWDKKKVSNILKNPLYCGFVDWDGIIKEGEHEAIIDKNTFLEAQKAFGTRSGKPYTALKVAGISRNN